MEQKQPDTSKVAILAVCIIAVLGLTVYRVVGSLHAATPVTDDTTKRTTATNNQPAVTPTNPASGLQVPGSSQPNTAATPGSNAPANAAGKDNKVAMVQPDVTKGPVPNVKQDPFKPPKGVPISETGSRQSAPESRSSEPPARQNGPSLPRLDVRDANSSGMTMANKPMSVAPPPSVDIELKGLITGEPPLAVISMGGEVSYRQEGDVLDGGFKVAKITEAGVVLKNGRKNYIIAVGHTIKPTAPVMKAAEQLVPKKIVKKTEITSIEALDAPFMVASKQQEFAPVQIASLRGFAIPVKRAAVKPAHKVPARVPAKPHRTPPVAKRAPVHRVTRHSSARKKVAVRRKRGSYRRYLAKVWCKRHHKYHRVWRYRLRRAHTAHAAAAVKSVNTAPASASH